MSPCLLREFTYYLFDLVSYFTGGGMGMGTGICFSHRINFLLIFGRLAVMHELW